MKIQFVTGNYPPEIGGAAHLFRDLAVGLNALGHEVTVVTCYPRYNFNEKPQQYQVGLRMKEVLDNVVVERIRLPNFPRSSKIARGLEHFLFAFYLCFLTSRLPNADAILVSSPPLPLPWMIEFVGKLRRTPVILNIQDLFPREAVELGMLKNRILIRLLEYMERQVYLNANAITVHSPGNMEHVVSHGGRENRVHVLYNWVDTDRIHPSPKNNEFAITHGLVDRFVVSYAGTMGWAQDMGTIIASANRLRQNTNIQFLLVGDGVEKEKAQIESAQLGLSNIIWLPMQPLSLYPDILAASDVSLINLHPELRTPVVPSKLLSIMAAGRAVIASLPLESDARRIIADAECGISVAAGDGNALAEAIGQLESNRKLTSDLGSRGRDYAVSNFSRNACTKNMESIIRMTKGVSS